MSDSTERPEGADHASVMSALVQRLRSQPLLLALGVALALATVATASVEGLRVLLPGVVVVTIVAIGAWLTTELVRLRGRRAAGGGEQVHLSARNVTETGEVIGIDDESGGPAGGAQVRLGAKDVSGRVVGVRRGQRRP
jgi:hypothetical protein